MTYGLPKSVTVNGNVYDIRSDFRDILELMRAINDPDITDQERAWVIVQIFYPDAEKIPTDDIEEAIHQCFIFLNGGREESPNSKDCPILVDWEKDFPLMIAPINRVLGHESRAEKYLHWWTFLSAYMEIGGDCTFAQVVHIREAQRRGRKLDDSDAEWYRQNKDLVDIAPRYTDADLEELQKWGGG